MNLDVSEHAQPAAVYQELFNSATLGIVVVNEAGIIQEINPYGLKLFKYELEELINQPVEVLIPAAVHAKHHQYRDAYFSDPSPRPMGAGRDLYAVQKGGATFPVEISLSFSESAGKKRVIAFISDIAERKKAEEALQRYAKALERSNRDLQDFAYVSSHDLQEPLRKIRAFGDRLQLKEENLSEKGHDYLQRMLNAAERMQRLINDLLEFSRINTRANDFEWIDLNDILKNVLNDLELSIEQSGAVVEVGPLPKIQAEPTHMWQLFQNLINNAIKFRKENVSPLIKVYHKTRDTPLLHQPKEVCIVVEDNGVGFDPKYKNKVFQVFQRLEGKKYKGSGIGLSICKRIANLHGGDIEVESEPGKGSRFLITLGITPQ